MKRGGRVFYGWVMVWTLGITTIVSYGTTQYLFGVLVVPIQEDLGWSRGTLAGAYSLGLVVAGLAGLPIGRLVDRHGARALMTAGSLLGAGALGLLSQVSAAWQFYLVWSGPLALSMALTFYPVTFVVVTNWFHRRRGSAMALLTLVGGLASVIFIPLAGLLIDRAGWRETLVVMAACQLLICVPLHGLVLRRHPEDLRLHPDGAAAAGASAPTAGHGAGEAMRAPAFWTLTISSGLALMANAVLLAHQIPFMIGRGFEPVFAAAVAGLLGAASLPSRLVLNLLSDRFGPRSMLALSTLLQALGVLLLLSAGGRPLLLAYVAVYGFAFGAVSPLRASVLAEQFGRRAFGTISAAQGALVALLAAAGPLGAGALYDRFGNYTLAFALTIAAFLASAVALVLTPPPRAAPASPPARAPAAA